MAEPAKPDGLLAQHHLLLSIIATTWATRLDVKVSGAIIQRYYPKFGNARASLSFLSVATLSDSRNVRTSLRRLIERGVMSVVREGKGTRPTEYGLNFDFAASVGADAHASSVCADTHYCVGADAHASGPSVGVSTHQTYLQYPADKAEILVSRTDPSAGATPPHQPGALAAPAGGEAATGWFDAELWPVIWRKHGYADAKAAAEEINPDAALAALVIAAARRWAKHYEEHEVEMRFRAMPANWLRGKRWLEDLPLVYPRSPKPKARAKPSPPPAPPANDNPPARLAAGRHTVEIVDSSLPPDKDGTKAIEVVFVVESDRREIRQGFVIKSDDFGAERDGGRRFASLCNAAGLDAVNDTGVLHGRAVVAVVAADGRWRFEAIMDEDEAQAAA